ncbi:MAG: hypothetical protein FJ144_13880 [Deltaproteobacteria bacterium]|nr:hypothetical protein [Deltaproteobacteria bacterium]
MLSPFAVRLRTQYLTSLGSTAGRLYAISTAGSLVGTLLAGFYLLPLFRVSTIFLGCSVALTIPALVYQTTRHRRGLALAASALVLTAASWRPATETRGGLRHVSESHFGQIKVLDSGKTRYMLVNGATQTLLDLETRASLAIYPPLLAKLAYQAKSDGKSALVIGLGGGALPPLFASWGVESVVVEIDPEVVTVDEDYFDFDTSATEVVIADGRQYLAATDRSFDYIVLDAFAGEVIPAHLLSTQMIDLVQQRLRPDGVLLVNFGGCRKGDDALPLRSLVKTVRHWLPWVEVYGTVRGDACGSNLVVASREPRSLADMPLPFDVAPRVQPRLDMGEPLDVDGPALLVTDDYNPLELWAVHGQEVWREGLLETLPPSILLAE